VSTVELSGEVVMEALKLLMTGEMKGGEEGEEMRIHHDRVMEGDTGQAIWAVAVQGDRMKDDVRGEEGLLLLMRIVMMVIEGMDEGCGVRSAGRYGFPLC
jgi:hypothetical protein